MADERSPRPLVRIYDGRYIEWCSCGTHPTPGGDVNGNGDYIVEYVNGPRIGVFMLAHPSCIRRWRKGSGA